MIVNQISYDEMTDLPPLVYKYRKWEDKYHQEILKEQIVFMSPPTSFEDDKDCKLQKRYDLLTREEIYNKYMQDSKVQNPERSRQQHRAFARDWSKKGLISSPKHLKKMQDEHFVEFDKRFGVLSLTANCSNFAMWTKYSDDHRGFCVGFDTKEMFQYLGGGGDVAYYDELPDIFPFDSHDEEHFKQVFSKERKWEFEQEYRTHKFYNTHATIKDRRIKIPIECYKEVIFGAFMPAENRQEIIAVCGEQNLDVDFLIEDIKDDKVTVIPFV